MKNVIFILVILLTFSCTAQQAADNRLKEIVFKNVSIIPMDKNEVLPNRDVVVKNGVVTAIGKTSKVKFGSDALVIDGKGKFLMPGLAEMHAHVPPVDDLEPSKEVLFLFAANGITTIRGM